MNWRILSLLILSSLVTSCRNAASASTEVQASAKDSFMPEGSVLISTGIPFTPTGVAMVTPAHLQVTTPTITILQVNVPSHTPTAAPTLTPSPTREYTLVDVYFVHKHRLVNDQPPFEAAGVRWAPSNNIMGTVLDEYFKGPGATERSSYGWIAVYDGFTGYSRVEAINGVVRLYLTGECKLDAPKYTIADILTYNLKKFPGVRYVKIYDQNGLTKDPFGISDSIPQCLEP